MTQEADDVPGVGRSREEVVASSQRVVGYAPGVFDMFHVGHLNVLRKAKSQCDFLIVGVVTDERVLATKGASPLMPLDERMEIVGALDLVDKVVVDDSTDKVQMWQRLNFDVIFKGDDWRGTAKGDNLERGMAAVGAEVIYFPYTTHISSTRMRALVASANDTQLQTIQPTTPPQKLN
jgi:glycerol-3-phosphate cytidylyltransferase